MNKLKILKKFRELIELKILNKWEMEKNVLNKLKLLNKHKILN